MHHRLHEPVSRYRPGGYHPVHIGDKFHENRFTILHKLGWGSYATIWLAKDTQEGYETDVFISKHNGFVTLYSRRYVALKFVVSNSHGRDKSNEIATLEHLRAAKNDHPGSEYVLGLLDHFDVSGPNGVHDVLVFEIVGPGPDCLREGNGKGETFVWQRSRLICKQITLGIAFLHERGIVHGGRSIMNQLTIHLMHLIRSTWSQYRILST